MVKKILADQTPVTRGFLLKIAVAMLGVIGAMIVFSFQAGGFFSSYARLSKIPASDIEKAVKYSVYDKDSRKDFYREYMTKNDLINQLQTADIESLKSWRMETKQDIKDIKVSIGRIEKSLERIK
jgi:cell shape-determining protein MreC